MARKNHGKKAAASRMLLEERGFEFKQIPQTPLFLGKHLTRIRLNVGFLTF
ncbi:MAG: hypothetical protein ACI8T1_001764 [Verrucomicrobiales bacterium]|jgi:hypothetical protein